MEIRKIKVKNNNKKLFLINHEKKQVESCKQNKDNNNLKEIYKVNYKEFEYFLLNKIELNYDNFLKYISKKYRIKKVNEKDLYFMKDNYFLDELTFIKDGDYDVLVFISYQINIFNHKKGKSDISYELYYLIKDNDTKKIYISFLKENEKVDIISHYQKNKKAILNKSLTDSFELLNYLSSYLNNEFQNDFIISKRSYNKIIKEFYPYLNNKLKEEKIKKDKDFSFIYFLINEHFIPFNSIASFIQKKPTLLEVNGDEEFISNLLKETSSYKQLKYIIPIANRETLNLLNNLNQNFFNKSKAPVDVKNRSHFVLSLLNLFETTEKLNEFIKESSFYLAQEKLDFKRIIVTDTLNSDNHLIRDIKAELPRFFNSKKQFENILIKQVKKYTSEIIENKKNEYYYDTPYELLYSILLNCISLYRHTLNIRKKYEDNHDLETVKLLDAYLDRKYVDFDDLHDTLTEIIQQIQYNPNAVFNPIKFKSLQHDSLEIKQVLNAANLRALGVEMNHCVLSYQPSIEDNEIVIFELINKYTNIKELCIEFKVHTNEIVQAKKYDNKIERDEVVLNYVSDFAKINHYKINTKDLEDICTN